RRFTACTCWRRLHWRSPRTPSWSIQSVQPAGGDGEGRFAQPVHGAVLALERDRAAAARPRRVVLGGPAAALGGWRGSGRRGRRVDGGSRTVCGAGRGRRALAVATAAGRRTDRVTIFRLETRRGGDRAGAMGFVQRRAARTAGLPLRAIAEDELPLGVLPRVGHRAAGVGASGAGVSGE